VQRQGLKETTNAITSENVELCENIKQIEESLQVLYKTMKNEAG
jgi:hypothetical protein